MTPGTRQATPSELAPGLAAMRADFDGVPYTLYVLLARRAVLIDTGVATTPRLHLAPMLRALGSELADVAWVVNTHAHHDHVGGNAEVLATAPGARLAVHWRDADWAESPQRYFGNLYRESFPESLRPSPEFEARIGALFATGAPVDRRLRGGEDLDVGGHVLRVIETPAHSPGHVALHDVSSGALFAGDAIQRWGTEIRGPRGWLFPLYTNLTTYRQGLRAIREHPDELVCTAHFGALRGAELERLLDESEEFADTIHELLDRLLRTRGEATLLDAQAALLDRWPRYQAGVQTLATPAAHLDALVEEGRAQAAIADGRKRWRAL